MLTGRHAFEGDSSLSTLSAILRDEVKPMTQVVPDVPPQLEKVIQRCMRKDPDERWQTIPEIRMELSALKRESDSGALYTSRISAQAVPKTAPPPVQSRSNRTTIVAVLAVLVVVIGVWTLSRRTPPTSPPAPAPATAPQPEAKAQPETLTNDGVLALIQEKVPVDLILDHIHSAKSTSFDLSTPELIRLNKAGVPRAVIDQMRNPAADLPVEAAKSTEAEAVPAPAP